MPEEYTVRPSPIETYIPENITVHLGPPGTYAPNVTVTFLDYIKNVASSEIYPTWPETAIAGKHYRADIVCSESCLYRILPQPRLRL